jgi:hypothetical protein
LKAPGLPIRRIVSEVTRCELGAVAAVGAKRANRPRTTAAVENAFLIQRQIYAPGPEHPIWTRPLHFGGGRLFVVLALVPFDEEDESPFVGMLKVEAA